ncbi:MAG: DciA family protein [Rhodocyclaceae bacterium]
MRSSTTPLGDLLGSSEALSRLQEHAGLLVRIQRIVDQQIPRAMRGAVAVANCREGTLALHVPTPSLASRLNMGMDSLRAALRDAGLAVEEIKVRVRPVQMAPDTHLYAREGRRIGNQGRAAFGELSGRLDADSPLGQAVARLLKHTG